MTETISSALKDRAVSINTDSQRPLLWMLRTELGLTGTKFGRRRSHYGTCAIPVNDRAIGSCVCPIRNASGRNVRTMEELSKNGALHPLQKVFVTRDDLQCEFCTSGIILTACVQIQDALALAREALIEGMGKNLYRWGANKRIIDAIQAAAAEKKGRTSSER